MPPAGKNKTKKSTSEACPNQAFDKHNSPSNCPVCLEIIKDPSDECQGEDSIHCDGVCNGWLHRRCAGLSVAAFKAINDGPDEAYCCPHCKLLGMSKEVVELKSVVNNLTKRLDALSSLFTTISTVSNSAATALQVQAVNQSGSLANSPPAGSSRSARSVNVSGRPLSPLSFDAASQRSNVQIVNRNLNVIVFDVPERPSGLRRGGCKILKRLQPYSLSHKSLNQS